MIIFTDLSEVLIRGIYGTEDIVGSLYGLENAKKFLARRHEVNDKILDLFRDKFEEDEYWKYFLSGSELSIDFSIDKLRKVLSRNIKKTVPGTLDLYLSISSHPESISKEGIPSENKLDGRPDIYIVSDHIRGRVGQIKDYHPRVFKNVEGEYWSFDIGHVKGDKEFFPKVLEMSKIPVEKIVFIDDIETNIKSARRNGIYSIQFYNAEQLKTDLSKIGFTFLE